MVISDSTDAGSAAWITDHEPMAEMTASQARHLNSDLVRFDIANPEHASNRRSEGFCIISSPRSRTQPMNPPLIDGLLNIAKPAGITSRAVVGRVVRAVGTRRVGHAGTLD